MVNHLPFVLACEAGECRAQFLDLLQGNSTPDCQPSEDSLFPPAKQLVKSIPKVEIVPGSGNAWYVQVETTMDSNLSESNFRKSPIQTQTTRPDMNIPALVSGVHDRSIKVDN